MSETIKLGFPAMSEEQQQLADELLNAKTRALELCWEFVDELEVFELEGADRATRDELIEAKQAIAAWRKASMAFINTI